MKIRYIGSADSRIMTKDDFKNNDHEHDEVVWDASNDFVATVSASVGKWLIEIDPDDFEEFKEK